MLSNTITSCITARRWVKVNSVDTLLAYHTRDGQRPVSQRRPMNMIAIMLVAEKENPAFKTKKWAMELHAFIQFMTSIKRSAKGMAGL